MQKGGSMRSELENKEVEKEVDHRRENSDDFIDILRLMAPGTQLRSAIDDVVRGKMGALIALSTQGIEHLYEGGFNVDCRFTPQRLMELCKMDGGILLSDDLKKILHANVLFVPDPTIATNETGTRHRAGERIAKQANTLVIAISERRNKITLFYKNLRYELVNSDEILRKTTETLRILEKQRELYDELLTNLNVLEVTGMVAVSDVCSILQRIEVVLKMSEIIKRGIVELGKEGIIVRMRLRELLKNIDKDRTSILEDYFGADHVRCDQVLSEMDFDSLLDNTNLSRVLFDQSVEVQLSPRGYRLLGKTFLNEGQVNSIVEHFGSLNGIFNSNMEEVTKLLGVKSEDFQRELMLLKEQIMVGKKI